MPSTPHPAPAGPWRRAGRLAWHWLPPLLWMGLIYALSARPVVPHPGRAVGLSDHLVDYCAHAAIFGALMLLTWRAARSLPRPPLGTSALLVAGAWSALYALADEVHQSFVPGRCATLPDLLADVVGIVAVGLVLLGWEALRSGAGPGALVEGVDCRTATVWRARPDAPNGRTPPAPRA